MTRFDTIASGLRFPEGPVALPDGSVLVVEMEAGALTRISPDGAIQRIARLGGSPNGAAIGPDGQCYVCNSGGYNFGTDEYGMRAMGPGGSYNGGRIERVNLKTGLFEVLYERSDKGPLCAPNDLVFDRQGNFWFTDTGRIRTRDMDLGGVYYAAADGSFCREMIFPLHMPNGIGLSPDQTRLYVAETFTARLWDFRLIAPGEIERLSYPSPNGGSLLFAGGGDFQYFDSLAVEESGTICVATLQKGGITMVSSQGGSLGHVPLQDRETTNICFGGPDRRRAFVTLSQTGKLVGLDWPRPGLALNYNG